MTMMAGVTIGPMVIELNDSVSMKGLECSQLGTGSLKDQVGYTLTRAPIFFLLKKMGYSCQLGFKRVQVKNTNEFIIANLFPDSFFKSDKEVLDIAGLKKLHQDKLLKGTNLNALVRTMFFNHALWKGSTPINLL